MGSGRREKSRRNSSTFTLIPRCVVGQMQPLKSLWQNRRNMNTRTLHSASLSHILPLFPPFFLLPLSNSLHISFSLSFSLGISVPQWQAQLGGFCGTVSEPSLSPSAGSCFCTTHKHTHTVLILAIITNVFKYCHSTFYFYFYTYLHVTRLNSSAK